MESKTGDGNSEVKFENLRGLEGHYDNMSSINGAYEASNMPDSNAASIGTKGLPTCAASLSSLSSKENLKDVQPIAVSFRDKQEAEGIQNKSSGEDKQIRHVGVNTKPLAVKCPKVEAESDMDDQSTKALNSVDKNNEVEEASELLVLPDAKETSTHSDPVNESDGSDIVEQDVKVCDICGDAGREDLLAVCCRCSEGAEHTYCMHEMLEKLPEGDWLCEDCKSEERRAHEKLKGDLVDGYGPDSRSRIPKHVNSMKPDLSEKLNGSDTDVDTIKAETDSSRHKLSRKRKTDDAEVSSVAKRRVLEPAIKSPKISSPRRIESLSRDSSFKNIDRGKVKSTHQIPSIVQTSDCAAEVASHSLDARPHISRGNFLKSKSFSSASAKPKVKLVDGVVPQKEKSNREASSLDTKGNFNRMMGKSMSFRSANSGRLTSADSKVQMLSPKFSHSQDIKGQKHTKERSLVERKNSLRLERPLVNSAAASSITSSPSGEGTRQSLLSSSASGTSKFVEKSIQARTKDDCLSLSTDQQLSKNSETIPDEAREATGGKITSCQKCKNVGHSAESCTIDSLEQSLASDVHTSRSLKGVIRQDNSLKAAIEAAMLKKPGIYRKNRVQDLSDESTVSGIKSEVCSHDQLSNALNPKKLVSGEEAGKELPSAWNSNAEFSKPGTYAKQITNSYEAVTALPHRPFPPVDDKSIIMDLPSIARSKISDLSIMSAIPEHGYIWQGCFEVCRSGKLPDRYDGFQAHLSACVSPRVLETMNKFPSTIFLDEVPRGSAWPKQFEENGVNEDHIALYFFARDYESYEKGYRSILENIMRNDLALKGNIDGVEILIFASNQLPDKYQRWNTMFFFWGVFIGKRKSCLQQVLGSQKIASSSNMPTAIISSNDNICSLVSVEKDLPTSNNAHKLVSDANSLMNLHCLPAAKTMNGDTDSKVLSNLQQNDCVNSTKVHQGYGLDCSSLPTNQMKSPELLQDTRNGTTFLEGEVDRDIKAIKEPKPSVQVASGGSFSSTSDEKKMDHRTTRFDMHPLPQIHDSTHGTKDHTSILSKREVDDEEKLRHGLSEAEAVAQRGEMRLSSAKELKRWPLSYRKRSGFDPPVSNSESTFSGSSQAVHGNDRKSSLDNEGTANKKQKLDYSDLYGLTDDTSSLRDGSRMQDSGSNLRNKRDDEDPDETSINKARGNAERYIIPISPYHVKHVDLDDNTVLQNSALSDDTKPIEDKTPNLELALGADMKVPLKQTVPHFLAAQIDQNTQDQPFGRTVTTAGEDASASAALSLSLSFPFADKEQEPVATKEPLPPGRQQEINFFREFPDK